jgi:transcriptional regulator with XRE-family HTH domain
MATAEQIKRVAETLKGARESKGWSLIQASQVSGLGWKEIEFLEEAQVSYGSPRVLYKLAQAYGLDYIELMTQAGNIVPKRGTI